MSDAIRRAHIRIVCDIPAAIFLGVSVGRKLGEGRFLDISLSGAYIEFVGELQQGTTYRAGFQSSEGPLELPCRVVREGPRGNTKIPGAKRYGLLFTLSADQEKQLRRFLDFLMRQPSTDKETRLDRSLRDYWSS